MSERALRGPARVARWSAVAACTAFLACGDPGRGTAPVALPDLLVVTLDTTRADHLCCYGYFRDTTPAIDALARESIVFERLIVPMATTLPSHVSLFTATAPLEHGVLANTTHGGRRFVAAPGLRSFAEVAADAGYRTAAFVSAPPLKRGSGIEAGFRTFDQPRTAEREAAETVDAALAWLAGLGSDPFLLWVHLYDAHRPYDAPPPYGQLFRSDPDLDAYIADRRIPDAGECALADAGEDARTSINAYDGEIRYQDAQLSRLIDRLRDSGRWERTAVLLAGDHGEGLCQHGEIAHGGTWNEQLHAPLLMRVPGRPPRRIAAPVSSTDILPTFLALLAVPALAFPAEQSSGRDVLSSPETADAVLSQDTGRPHDGPYRFALTTDRWKYLRSEEPGGVREELFDLEADPHELRDVAQAQPEVVLRLRGILEGGIAAQRARGSALRRGREPETRPVDAETLEQLRALGYEAE